MTKSIPERYRATLLGAATKYGADPAIIAAMCEVESGWNTLAVGDAGHSVGLLQLHDQGLGAGLTHQQREDPEINLEWGIRAHADYVRLLGLPAGIAAHNAGINAVRSAIEQGGDDAWRKIAGGRVGKYVDKVLALAEEYRPGLGDASWDGAMQALNIQRGALYGFGDPAVIRAYTPEALGAHLRAIQAAIGDHLAALTAARHGGG